jgi:hypothetical protein
LACDSEAGGKTGEGIAWLRGARKELGFVSSGADHEKKSFGFSKLKKEFQEKKEDRKIEKGEGWGTDAGKFEEGRIVDMLLKKWEKMNDTVRIVQTQRRGFADRHVRWAFSSYPHQSHCLQACPLGASITHQRCGSSRLSTRTRSYA